MTEQERNPIGPEDDLRKVINRHGYAFQEAVLRRGQELFEARRSNWVFDSAEVPVEVRGVQTRIDFLLYESRREAWGPLSYLVAECKRVNPALSNWCFTKSQYVRRNSSSDNVIVDQVMAGEPRLTVSRGILSYGQEVYHQGYEVRSDSKGDGAPDRSAIESACGQVLRGLNGLIALFRQRPKVLIPNHPTPLISVVFTTARLWTTEADLSDADLASGELDKGALSLASTPWLWYRYHASPALTDPEPKTSDANEIGKLVEHWYARCVAIVSTAGIDDFLAREHDRDTAPASTGV